MLTVNFGFAYKSAFLHLKLFCQDSFLLKHVVVSERLVSVSVYAFSLRTSSSPGSWLL